MYDRLNTIAKRLKKELFEDRGLSLPRIGIILGSGLGSFTQHIEDLGAVEYADIEGFVKSTVEGHRGRFVSGTVNGVSVMAMEGRVHYYEGYSIHESVMGARILCLMGIETLIVTNAAGGINETFEVGDIMIIRDHINLLPNPLIGPNDERFGVRFQDMSRPYCQENRDLVKECAKECDVKLQEGVYLGSSGPTYETPAEYEYFARIGGDACGMSTTPEVIVARHMGVEILGLSVITNIGRGPNASKFNAHEDVVEASNNASLRLQKVVKTFIGKL